MTTDIYWLCTFSGIIAILGVVGFKWKHWIAALILSGITLAVGAGYYYFYFQNILVKRWGGEMAIKVPDGQHHLQVTWKDDNLWVENYDPKTNTCIFSEYSRGNIFQGEVKVKNCNPLMPNPTPP
jgi:hypothetical protein